MAEKKIRIETHDELCDALFNAGAYEDPQPTPRLPEPPSGSEVHSLLFWLLAGLLIWVVGFATIWVCW